MKLYLLILVLPIFSLLMACGDTAVQEAPAAKELKASPGLVHKDWSTTESDHFSISHPKDWKADQSGKMGTKLILFAPVEGAVNTFNENINVLTEKLPSDAIALKQYVEASLKQIKNFITDAKIITNQPIMVNGKEYHKLVYSGKQGEMDLQFQQYFTLKGGTAYVVTMTTKQDSFNDFKDIGSQIMDTFTIS